MNYYTPTTKPIGWDTNQAGRRKRIYDPPQTPFDRLIESQALTATQVQEMTAYRDGLNPAALARNIAKIQHQLEALAKRSTLKLIKNTTALIPAQTGLKQAG